MKIRYPLTFALSLMMSFNVAAWGPRGHITTAELAYKALSPSATEGVADLLQDGARDGLAAASIWADQQRELGRLKSSTKWHYINFPPGQCQYDKARDCADGQCMIEALRTQVSILRDPNQPKQKRADALRWVTHLVGDIHQPFHAGLKADLGGNRFQVRYGNAGTNLHVLWDYHLIAKRAMRSRALAKHLFETEVLKQAVGGSPATINADIAQWASNSCTLVQTKAYPKTKIIDAEYIRQSDAIISQQLRLAGARLAVILNGAFDD